MTQIKKILDYCEKHGSVTIREAFTELNINSPSKRISEIRRSGLFDVKQEKVETENSWFVRYFIKPINGDANG